MIQNNYQKKCAKFAERIKEHAFSYSYSFSTSVEEIDRLNIYEATKQSMKESIESVKMYNRICISRCNDITNSDSATFDY